MKRRLTILLVGSMLLSLAFAGCRQGYDPHTSTNTNAHDARHGGVLPGGRGPHVPSRQLHRHDPGHAGPI